MNTFAGRTAQQWRDMAHSSFKNASDSFQRCDTDGFLSQWAHDVMGQRYLDCAKVAEDDGNIAHPALFDLDGNYVPAVGFEGKYGFSYGILNPDSPDDNFVKFFSPSAARNEERRVANNAKKGYYVGKAMFPAYVEKSTGIVKAYCKDGPVEILDSGK